MAGAVDVGVVAGFGLVFDVGGADGDAAFAFFGGFVDGAVFEVVCEALFGLSFRDGCCQSCLEEWLDIDCITPYPYT